MVSISGGRGVSCGGFCLWWYCDNTHILYSLMDDFHQRAHFAGVSLVFVQSLLLCWSPHMTHAYGLLQLLHVCPYCWQHAHWGMWFLLFLGCSMWMSLFCIAVKLYTSLSFRAGSRSRKNRLIGSFVILWRTFTIFLATCPCSSRSCLVSSISVEWWKYLSTTL